MKDILRITLFAAFAVAVSAGTALGQPQDNTPSWIATKPVSKIANRKLFEDHRLNASHIRATTSAHASRVSAKAVHGPYKEKAEGNVRSKGYPAWTISKAVHRK